MTCSKFYDFSLPMGLAEARMAAGTYWCINKCEWVNNSPLQSDLRCCNGTGKYKGAVHVEFNSQNLQKVKFSVLSLNHVIVSLNEYIS